VLHYLSLGLLTHLLRIPGGLVHLTPDFLSYYHAPELNFHIALGFNEHRNGDPDGA
jgi:hypothetical protein